MAKAKTLCTVYGQWITKSAAPTFGAFQEEDTYHKIDLTPSDENHKLLVALKWMVEDYCYAYAKESFVHSKNKDGRDDGRKIPPGHHAVRITLKGTGVIENFDFVLVNPGKGSSLSMETMPSKKTDRKDIDHNINREQFHKMLDMASKPINTR